MGYVGLPTAATLAHLGHRVTCGDSDPAKIALLEQGRVPIVEDHLEELVREGQASGACGSWSAPRKPSRAPSSSSCACPPRRAPTARPTSRYVEAVAKEIGPHLMPGTVIVNKSTVPVGSTLVVDRVLGRHDVSVVSNPEFLREGTAVADSLHPERIVVGADDQAAAAKVGELFAGTHAPLLITDAATAETIKYAANAFLATKLSFVNAVAGLCEAVGADVRDVILGLGYDKRIGFEYLRPGPGWGGSCLPKDTRALVHIADQAGYDFSFLKGAIATNEEQFARVVDKVTRRGRRADLEGAVVAAWGLTFKAGTDDLRNSPAVEVVRRLVDGGAIVRAFDPTISVPEDHPSAPVDGARRAGARRGEPEPVDLGARLPRRLRRLRGCHGRGGPHRVGRVPLAGLRPGHGGDGVAGGGGRPQPPRPVTAPPDRLRVHGYRPSVSRRLVVLGGGGFLGSHLCDALVARGDRVVCVDDFSTGRRANVAHLRDDPAFTLVEADITRVDPGRGRRWPGSSTWPARPRPRTTWPARSRPWRWAARAPGTGSSWPAPRGAVPAGLDQRGLRRSRGAPPARGVLGTT